MAKVTNLTKYKYERNKVIDEQIFNAEERIIELELLIYSWKLLKH